MRRYRATLPKSRHSLLLTLLPLLLFLAPVSADAIDWQSVGIDRTSSFKDGAGMNRTMTIRSLRFDEDAEDYAAVMINVTIDGENRTVVYTVNSNDLLTMSVHGSSAKDHIALNLHLPSGPNIANKVQAAREAARMKKKGIIYTLIYGNERLAGNFGESVFGFSGTDPISFAALSANPGVSPAVINALKGVDDSEPASSALKIFGKIFGGKIGGAARCAKKKVESIKCDAHCTAGENGCDCECLGIPCCAECTKTTETVWEYSVGVEAG